MLEFFRNFSQKRRERVAYLDFVEDCEDGLAHLDEVNDREWGFRQARRHLDEVSGRVHFVGSDGRLMTFQALVVGMLLAPPDADVGLWRWGWDLPDIPARLTEPTDKIRQHGNSHQMERLIHSGYQASLIEAWGFTAIAARLCNARGAYAEKVPLGYALIAFRDIEFTNKPVAHAAIHSVVNADFTAA